MKKILLPILSLILAACSSSQVTVTRYAQVTGTSSPPTATPIPTPTLHPQFIALQESIAASGERFTLAPDGTIQDGAKTVPGLSVDKNGAITLQGDSLPAQAGSQVTISPEDVSFDDEKGVSVEGYTLDEATGKWGVEVIKEYPICAPENFRDCEIPVEELFDGTYFHWLEEQAKTLACSPNMRTDVKMVKWARDVIIPNPDTAPNFNKPDSEFFIRDHTAGFAKFILPDGQEVHYAVMPLFMCDLTDNTKLYPIITVFSAFNPSKNQNEANELYINDVMHRWRQDMNITPIVAGYSQAYPAREGIIDPMVKRTYDENSDMDNRLEEFINGNWEVLSKQGIVLLNDVATNRAHKYE